MALVIKHVTEARKRLNVIKKIDRNGKVLQQFQRLRTEIKVIQPVKIRPPIAPSLKNSSPCLIAPPLAARNCRLDNDYARSPAIPVIARKNLPLRSLDINLQKVNGMREVFRKDHCKRGSRHRQRNNRRLPYGLGRQRIGKARKAVQTRCGIKHAVAHFFTTNDLQVDVVRAVPLQLSEPPRQRLDIHPTPPALVESNCDGVDDRGVGADVHVEPGRDVREAAVQQYVLAVLRVGAEQVGYSRSRRAERVERDSLTGSRSRVPANKTRSAPPLLPRRDSW